LGCYGHMNRGKIDGIWDGRRGCWGGLWDGNGRILYSTDRPVENLLPLE